jgi:hypothetical protein
MMAHRKLPRDRDAIVAEIRAVCGELVGELRTVSESVSPLTRSGMRSLILELEHQLAHLSRLVDQLP